MASLHDVMDINSRSNHKSKSAPKKLREITLSHAENGGYIAEHRFHNNEGPYHDPETHVFGKGEGKKLIAHLHQHLGVSAEVKGDKDSAAGAAS
jgi:hypothetical protein